MEKPPAWGSDVLRCHLWCLPPPPWPWGRKATPCLHVSSADKCIQNVYRDLRLQRKSAKEYMGILCSLIMQDKLPLDDIKASVTEMMAGGVDTVRSGQGCRAGRSSWLVLSLAPLPRSRPP